jgi:hypothetical protein
MSKHNCLLSAAERVMRRQDKRQKLLRYLREELWSVSDLLAPVMGVRSRQAVWKTLKQYEAEEIVRCYEFEALGGKVSLWGITAHGQALAFDPNSETPNRYYFEPSKVSEFTLRHSLDVQRLRIIAEVNGWTGWRNGQTLGTVGKGMNRPDAIAFDPTGLRVALECERTIKTPKRYCVILAGYLQALKRGEFSRVVWICPTADLAARLKKIVCGIQTVVVNGQRVPIDPTRHHVNLRFEDYVSFGSIPARKSEPK